MKSGNRSANENESEDYRRRWRARREEMIDSSRIEWGKERTGQGRGQAGRWAGGAGGQHEKCTLLVSDRAERVSVLQFGDSKRMSDTFEVIDATGGT